MDQCFKVTREDELCLVKNVLNHFASKEYFAEMIQSIWFDKGGDYELDEVPGMATWGPNSEQDLNEVWAFNQFTGIRFFYDHDWRGGIQESEYQDIELSKLATFLPQAMEWNLSIYPSKSFQLQQLAKLVAAHGS